MVNASVILYMLVHTRLHPLSMGDEGVSRMAEALPHTTTLDTLDLGGNKLGHEGIAKLAEALRVGGTSSARCSNVIGRLKSITSGLDVARVRDG